MACVCDIIETPCLFCVQNPITYHIYISVYINGKVTKCQTTRKIHKIKIPRLNKDELANAMSRDVQPIEGLKSRVV